MGQSVLIHGAGPIGIMCMMVAKAAGASQVMMTEVHNERLALAKSLGASHTLYVKGMTPVEIRDAVVKSLGQEPEVTIECTGAQPCLESAILATRPGGVLVMVGLGAPRIELPIVEAALREIDIRGVFRYASW
ncbi:D-xylulose reductase domain protein [Oesophagostomum dentatum]|uniref:Sorbitol dehydrogenase n=1 Tax=Oesophagostomum dentatum TaxID=61180 RepID=A0A0B1S046_OESDE|nr:D-xylulose reductase domain protein [Oesophagostomum dentatum]